MYIAVLVMLLSTFLSLHEYKITGSDFTQYILKDNQVRAWGEDEHKHYTD